MDENGVPMISQAMKEESIDVLNLMDKWVFKDHHSFLLPLAILNISACDTLDNSIAVAMSQLVTGVFLYRRMLIESGVDVIALEKEFKPLTMWDGQGL